MLLPLRYFVRTFYVSLGRLLTTLVFRIDYIPREFLFVSHALAYDRYVSVCVPYFSCGAISMRSARSLGRSTEALRFITT